MLQMSCTLGLFLTNAIAILVAFPFVGDTVGSSYGSAAIGVPTFLVTW